MIFRRHTPQDFPRIAALRWGLKTEELDPVERPDRTGFETAYLAQLQKQDQSVHWVLETGQGVAGVMTLRAVAKETSLAGHTGQWGYLTNVYLAPSLRGQGHGGAMLQGLISHARKTGFEFLLVWPSERSRSFYRRAGFTGIEDPLTLELA